MTYEQLISDYQRYDGPVPQQRDYRTSKACARNMVRGNLRAIRLGNDIARKDFEIYWTIYRGAK